MVSVDVRTRTAADERPVDAARFFEGELPDLIAERSALAVPGAQELHPRPMAFVVDGASWTLVLDGDQLRVQPGQEGAAAIVRLDTEDLSDLVNDIRTPMGMFTGGDLDMPAGGLDDFLDWWVVLRSLLDGRPVHTTGSVTFADRDGHPLDLRAGVRRRRGPRGDVALPRRGRLPPPRRRLRSGRDGRRLRGDGRRRPQLLVG